MNKRILVLGWGIILGLMYVTISHILVFIPPIANVIGYGIPNDFLRKEQHDYYMKAPMRSVIQGDANCARPDYELGYIFKNGECEFNNFEFNTILKFDKNGAIIDTKINTQLPKIIVLGDSHAMGWGVSYNETFSYKLGELGFHVRNYAMSSFGTEQQIRSALLSDIFLDSKFIVIQYCDNDLPINKKNIDIYKGNLMDRHLQIKRKEEITAFDLYRKLNFASRFLISRYSFGKTLMYPINITKTENSGHYKKEYPEQITAVHQQIFIEIVKRYERLKGKKLIVFYSNGHGKKFKNWDRIAGNIKFVDLRLTSEDYYKIDDHLNKRAHAKIASSISSILLDFNH